MKNFALVTVLAFLSAAAWAKGPGTPAANTSAPGDPGNGVNLAPAPIPGIPSVTSPTDVGGAATSGGNPSVTNGTNATVTGPSTNGVAGTQSPGQGITPDTGALAGSSLSRSQVLDAQRALSANGFMVTADGISGPQTEAAVRSFQAQHGLAQTGQLDANTVNALNAATQNPSQNKASETPTGL